MTGYGKRIELSSNLNILHPLDAMDSCSNGRTFLSTKHDDGDSSLSEYVYKELDEDDDPFIGTCEAVMSDCYQIISPKITPEVYVISNGNKPTAVISKLIKNYKSYGDCTSEELDKLLYNKKKELAALLVSAYINADDDLHDDNWGFDLIKTKNNQIDYKNSRIVKIDNDLAAFPHTYHYSGRAEREKKAKVITQFPNRSYKASETFDISTIDIKNFPLLKIHKPNHWPFRKNTKFTDFLSHDHEFNNAKFFYFTKALLLDKQRLQALIKSHSHDIDKNKADELLNYLMDRITKLRQCLICIPEYHQYLKRTPNLINKILEQIAYYNKKFYYNDTKKIKLNMEDQIISGQHVISTVSQIIKTCEIKSQDPDYKKVESLIKETEISNLISKEEESVKYLRSFIDDKKILTLIIQRTTMISKLKNELTKMRSTSLDLM